MAAGLYNQPITWHFHNPYNYKLFFFFFPHRIIISALLLEEMEEPEAPTSTPASRFKIGCLSAATSFKQTCLYVKASLIAQMKKLSANTEAEASEADLLTAKMQVQAADDAENTKKQLHNKYT